MEAALRLVIFLAIFAAAAGLEYRYPRRPWQYARWPRWQTNLSLTAVDILLQRLTLGAAAYSTALYAQTHGWGLLSAVSWPGWLEGLLAILFLDLAIYLQHVLSHALPVFWRLHQVHHADLELDVSSGLRFHPLEILVSLLYKVLLVAAIGAPAWAVLLFEALLNGAALFTHANIHLPERLDQRLRWLICTPDMHRVHHSTQREETDSNFGFFLSIWDRLGGTLRAAPAAGHTAVQLGLPYQRDPAELTLWGLLRLPFKTGGVS